MSLPKFETEVVDLDSPEDLNKVFFDFTEQITREDLFLGAEWYVRERIPGSSVYSFNQMHGGLMGRVMGLIAMACVDSMRGGLSNELDNKLLAHYGFDADSIPPRLLIREAVALRIQLNTMLADLNKVTEIEWSDLEDSIRAAAGGLLLPQDGYSLTNVQVDEVLLR